MSLFRTVRALSAPDLVSEASYKVTRLNDTVRSIAVYSSTPT